MNFHLRLAIRSSREHLALFGWNCRVALNQRRGDPTQRFDAQRQGRYVQEQHIFYITTQNTGLNGRTNAHDLVGIHALVRLFAKELANCFLNGRHAGHTTNQHNLSDLTNRHAGIFQCLTAGFDGTLHQLIG